MSSDTKRKARTLAMRQRRLQVAEMYLTARTQREIAVALKVSQSTVAQDLKILQADWMNRAASAIEEVKARELAKIDALEREYWDSWVASQQTKETTTTAQTSDDAGVSQRAQIRTEKRDGDPRYLAGVQWCIDKRCQILGLNAPNKNMNLNRNIADLTDEELDREIKKYGLSS